MKTEITIEDLLNLEGVDFELPNEQGEGNETPEKQEEENKDIVPEENKVNVEPTEEKVESTSKNLENKTPEFYHNLSKKFLEQGKWKDCIVEIDGEEKKLSELESIDEKTFFDIYSAQEEDIEEDIKNNYISVKEIDDNKKRLINIIKNGGDLKEIFQNENNLKRPFENVDVTDETTLKAIVFQQYRKQGLSESEARELTEKSAKELTLDTKAESIIKAYQEHYDKMVEQYEKETIEARKAEEESIKTYRKSLTTALKEDGLADTLVKRMVDAATKKDEHGEFIIDSIYQKIMEDPEKSKELIFFMLEPENFLKAKGASIKTGEQLNMIKKVKILRDTTSKTTTQKEEEPKNTDVFSNLIFE